MIRPTKWMYWNVHIDGLEYTHDLIVEREGVFKECVEAVRMAKILGYQVATNTTVYKETDASEIEEMFEFFSSMEVNRLIWASNVNRQSACWTWRSCATSRRLV